MIVTPIDTRVLFDRDRLFVIQKKDHIFEINVFKMLQKNKFLFGMTTQNFGFV